MELYLLNYNNYYNRKILREESLEEYQSYVITKMPGIDFNPNDGVNTEQILEYNGAINPDYIIVAQNNNIISRWFVIDSDRLRGGQYRAILHRDVIADNYTIVINAPCYIEKATLPDFDPFIYNSEGMSFNQVKTSETLLRDNTNSAWIVGYFDNKSSETQLIRSITAQPSHIVDDIAEYSFYRGEKQDAIYNLIEDIQFDMNFSYNSILEEKDNFSYPPIPQTNKKIHIATRFSGIGEINNFVGALASDQSSSLYSGIYISAGPNNAYIPQRINELVTNLNNNKVAIMAGLNAMCNTIDKPTYNYILESNGKIIFDKTHGKYYKVVVSMEDVAVKKIYDFRAKIKNYNGIKLQMQNSVRGSKFIFNDNIALYPTGNQIGRQIDARTPLNTDMQDLASLLTDITETSNKGFINFLSPYNGQNVFSENATSSNGEVINKEFALYPYMYTFQIMINTVKVHLEDITTQITTFGTISGKRQHLQDSPYDMFCIPATGGYKFYIDNIEYTTNSIMSYNIANAIASYYGGSTARYLYDLQLLPYCPVRELINSNGNVNVLSSQKDVQYSPIILDNQIKSIILWASTSTGSFNIPYSIEISEKKIENECDIYRMVSPNYSGIFEFSAAKNNGVDFINVDFKYKPYTPYIHLNPNFKYMYGNDYNDNRGLVCGGDFSLPIVTDQWSSYELSNKNYQLMFDREIQTMDLHNRINRQTQIFGIGANAISQGVASSIYGGGMGALFGGGASLIGGIADYRNSEILRNEAMDYRNDMFEYTLGNVKALPMSISKIGAITPNHKIFPFVEYYTCTNYEKQALRNKIKYHGMTVNRIGHIADFLQSEPSFISGKIIRLEGLNDDFHIAKTIADEISKGVFI